MSAFMAQAGTIVICGDAGGSLGDSLYEAVIYVAGRIEGLGTDAREEPMTPADTARVNALLEQAGIRAEVGAFKRVASAKTLYHWNVEADQEY
jgi:glutamate synthase domain-containing protein 3